MEDGEGETRNFQKSTRSRRTPFRRSLFLFFHHREVFPSSMSRTLTMEQGPNLRSQDVRNRRIGGEQPYRDDPKGGPVHVDSFSRGGYGPADGGGEYKGKQATSSSSPSTDCYTFCCEVSNANDPLYYQDNFNDLSWTFRPGTTDEHGIWVNQADPAGTIMAAMVWVLLLYSELTITLLAQTGGIHWWWSWCYSCVCSLALACHVKTSVTDPGSVPPSAVPTEVQRKQDKLSMCSQCQTFKPPHSHHCRICNRCISRMDHHCPWMNNCVGAGNMKHFFLFLIYTWSCTVVALCLMGSNYFFCSSQDCEFNIVLTQLVRIMTILSICAFLFTSSMLMNVVYGLITGIGTIDRLKKKATETMNDSEEEPIPLTDVFGIGPLWTWPFPSDPLFEDYDGVMGFSTPQRLLREQILREQRDGDGPYSPV